MNERYPRCFNCDEPASASWLGAGGSVHVCRACAISALPALIADATIQPSSDANNRLAIETLIQVEAVYWRAIAAELAHVLADRESIEL